MVDVAEIRIWGQLVGAVRWNAESQLASFQYAKEFLRSGLELSPIKMPLKDGSRVFRFPELSGMSTFSGLPGMIADSLPDRYGHALLETWLAQMGRPSESMNPVEKLCFIGSRSMGAFEYAPAMVAGGGRSDVMEIDALVEIAKKMLHRRETFATNINKYDKQAMLDVLKIGTSAGGARPKAIIAYNPKSGEVRSGQAEAPAGYMHYLIKLDGVSDAQFGESEGWGRVEMAYYEMARACEIDMMHSELFEEHGRAHFLTKRFDRDGRSDRYHIQTWCALEHFDYNDVHHFSYEQLFRTMRTLRLSYPEAEQMYRRMVFNVLAMNCDDHTKNFAFRLQENGRWELAPAYDICHAYRPGSEWVSQHALSVNGKRFHISDSDLLAVAELVNVRNPEGIIDQIREVVSRWREYAEEQGVPRELMEAIGETTG